MATHSKDAEEWRRKRDWVRPETVTAEARLHRDGVRVLCGSKQHDGRYWCDGEIGSIVPWQYPLRAPYAITAPAVKELGFDIITEQGNRVELDFLDAQARYLVVVRFLFFPDGWGKQIQGYYGEGRHARRAAERNRRFGTRLPLTRRIGLPSALPLYAGEGSPPYPDGQTVVFPTHYPALARCPSPRCGLVQWLRADAAHLRVKVFGDDSHHDLWDAGKGDIESMMPFGGDDYYRRRRIT